MDEVDGFENIVGDFFIGGIVLGGLVFKVHQVGKKYSVGDGKNLVSMGVNDGSPKRSIIFSPP